MRYFSFAIASLWMLLVVPQIMKADITYDIQNYPAYQVDYTNGSSEHTLSGTIMTNGTIGTLSSTDILSWTVTFDGTETIKSTDPGAIASVSGPVYSSIGNITVGTGASLDFSESFPGGGGGLLGYSNGYSSGFDYIARFSLTSSEGILWLTPTTNLGGNPWVVAAVQTTIVPEPSTLTIAGVASVCGIAYGLARKRKAQCKPSNEP